MKIFVLKNTARRGIMQSRENKHVARLASARITRSSRDRILQSARRAQQMVLEVILAALDDLLSV